LEVQTVWGEGGRSGISALAFNDLMHPLWGLKTLANDHQTTHDVANHVVQEGIAFKFKSPVRAMFGDVNAHHGFNGRQGLATAGPEG
jgi:hypothetical protein